MNFKLKLFSGTILLATACSGFASGFQLWEQDAAGIGDYHAGAAADTSNTGIEFYNPAGMVFMERPVPQISVGGTYIGVNAKFNGSVTNTLFPTTPAQTNGWQDGSTNNFVPNGHLVVPVGKRVALGFGVTTPFGLETNWPDSSPINQAATKTKLETINLNPSLAIKLTDWVAVGLGVSAQYASADFDEVLGGTDTSHFHAWSWGWNTGLFFKPAANTSIGVAYRSHVTQKAKGTNTLAGFGTNSITAELPLPATVTVSAEQTINQWQILGSAVYTNWHVFDKLVMTNMNIIGTNKDVTIPFNYRDTWNFALGAHYTLNKNITFLAGTGYDMTPTNNQDRDIRLPGSDRVALSLGVKALDNSGRFAIATGYTRLIATNNAKINNNGPQIPSSTPLIITKGTAKTSANVFGIQVTAYM